jgi:hypothetical protein
LARRPFLLGFTPSVLSTSGSARLGRSLAGGAAVVASSLRFFLPELSVAFPEEFPAVVLFELIDVEFVVAVAFDVALLEVVEGEHAVALAVPFALPLAVPLVVAFSGLHGVFVVTFNVALDVVV